MAVEKPDKEKFTFWANMRETIEQNDSIELKYKLYSALTKYGLYGEEPDKDDKDYGVIMMLLQSMKLTIDKSKEISKQKAEIGAIGGAQKRIFKDDIEEAVVKATKDLKKVPTLKEVSATYQKMFGKNISTKSMGREGFKATEVYDVAQKVLNGTYKTNKTKAEFCPQWDK